jgi:dolichol-phosphate mannosyltransferase
MPLHTLVVIPTYNEAGNIVSLLHGVLAQQHGIEVLVVDDASSDGTAESVESVRMTEARVHLLRRPGKLGLGSAYLAGFRHALDRGFDAVFTMDGDWSHDPIYLGKMLDALSDHDVVIGSRYVRGGELKNWSLHRRALSRFANWYTRWLLRIPHRDVTSGYRGYRREALESVDPFSIRESGYSFLEEMIWRLHRAGLSITEIPIVFTDRCTGTSKIESSEILKAAYHVMTTALRRRRSSRARPEFEKARRGVSAP